jgi:hypothetical protein
MQGKGPYPFAEKQARYRAFSDAALAWSLRDAIEARNICGSIDLATYGWYADDASTITDEIARRQGKRR